MTPEAPGEAGGRYTTRLENAHGTEFRELLCPWHPRFGLRGAVHQARSTGRTASLFAVARVCGRLPVGKKNLHVARLVGGSHVVRPVGATHMTAGHSARRGSGPDQKPAFDNAVHLLS
jgi:hypothetical protein